MLYAPEKGVQMVHEWTGPVTRGNMCDAHRVLYVHYENPPLLLLLKVKTQAQIWTLSMKYQNK